jgi:twitching motility protein PilT
MNIVELLKLTVNKGASDLHFTVGSPPVLRIDGVLVPQEDLPLLTAKDIDSAFEQVSTQEQSETFSKELELDFAYSVPRLARFRVNAMKQRGSLGLAFRCIPFDVPSIDELGLPGTCKELILKPKGLILVTGPTGCGKSTTLAAMINHLNQSATRSVITIEDPIEFLFENKRCIIRQRELGGDTKSFSNALVKCLRHDADVIVVGEMRDLATMGAAMQAAETGHLVLGTLHTIDAVQTIDRVISMFPAEGQQQIRLQLSQTVEAIMSQILLPRIGGGRIVAVETIIANSVIRKLIREEKSYEIPANIEMSKLVGMQTMEQALASLVRQNMVTREEALQRSSNPIKLMQFLG